MHPRAPTLTGHLGLKVPVFVSVQHEWAIEGDVEELQALLVQRLAGGGETVLDEAHARKNNRAIDLVVNEPVNRFDIDALSPGVLLYIA
jgi:hypothetical protein